MRLAALDDRMLADIGLNRSDLRDAFAVPPWRDPSDVLARRAAERRGGRRLTDRVPVQRRLAGAVTRRPIGLPAIWSDRVSALADPPIGQPSGTAVSPPALRMLRPPPPGGRILFRSLSCAGCDVRSNRASHSHTRALH